MLLQIFKILFFRIFLFCELFTKISTLMLGVEDTLLSIFNIENAALFDLSTKNVGIFFK